ncbi:uncharacterized protein F5147DRAFT_781029 [Suillus discolor]|uniref:Uncharacterized protein n=1 Tax=Suillus discolor TaxID=1912936 RepID=A0A9P7EU35_9AGAM|nr:uncharacterized protein F5147DRAFT_781029 [Suillus discolor]KAG2088393.1 hypothetical protein F5147DRAFT_781029 [Suillus discolor]
MGKDRRILPPPHELIRNISLPTPSQPVAGPSSDSVRTFDYPPHASPESQASTKMSISQSSTIPALEIIGLPNMTSRDKRRERNGLSIIHEDASIDAIAIAAKDTTKETDSEATKHSWRDPSKQRLADELRWSNSAEPEEWHRYGADKSRLPSDAPSRRASIFGLLSPDHANHPLPVSVLVSQRAPLVPTFPNTPVSAPVSLVGSMYDIGQLPTGAPPPGGPVIPYMNEREAPSQRSSLYAAAQAEGRRSQTPQSYVASPVPTGVSYPAPPISSQTAPYRVEAVPRRMNAGRV